MRVTGRAAVVTGGAVGIGLAVAERLRAEGARVALIDRDQRLGEQAAERIGAVFVLADLADRARVAPAVGTAAERLGRLDILINNAGGAGHGSHYPSASP